MITTVNKGISCKCYCALFSLCLIIGIGITAFIFRDKLVQEYNKFTRNTRGFSNNKNNFIGVKLEISTEKRSDPSSKVIDGYHIDLDEDEKLMTQNDFNLDKKLKTSTTPASETIKDFLHESSGTENQRDEDSKDYKYDDDYFNQTTTASKTTTKSSSEESDSNFQRDEERIPVKEYEENLDVTMPSPKQENSNVGLDSKLQNDEENYDDEYDD